MSKKIDEFTSSGFAHQNATRPNTVGRTTKQTPGNTKRKMISRKPTKMVPAGKGWEDLHKIAPGISPALPRNADSPENLSKIKDIDPNSVGNYKDTPMPDNSKVKYKSKPRKAKTPSHAMNKYVESNKHSKADVYEAWMQYRDNDKFVPLSESKKKK